MFGLDGGSRIGEDLYDNVMEEVTGRGKEQGKGERRRNGECGVVDAKVQEFKASLGYRRLCLRKRKEGMYDLPWVLKAW